MRLLSSRGESDSTKECNIGYQDPQIINKLHNQHRFLQRVHPSLIGPTKDFEFSGVFPMEENKDIDLENLLQKTVLRGAHA